MESMHPMSRVIDESRADATPFIDRQIKTIEEAAKEIKRLSGGVKAIDINTDSILAFTYILRQNVSDVVELKE